MAPFQTIVHPTDFSDYARYAFNLACTLAKVHGSRLVVAHVIDVEYGKHSFGGTMVEVRPPDYPERLLEQLKSLQPAGADVPVEHKLMEGRPVEEILRLAKETQSDLIVMGTHGLTGVKRLLLGSVAEQIVRQAPCPVVAVKSPVSAAEPGQDFSESMRGAFTTPHV